MAVEPEVEGEVSRMSTYVAERTPAQTHTHANALARTKLSTRGSILRNGAPDEMCLDRSQAAGSVCGTTTLSSGGSRASDDVENVLSTRDDGRDCLS